MTHRKEKPARMAPPLPQASAVLLLLGLLTACSSDGANDPASKKSKPASICKDGVWPTEAAGQPKSLKAKPDKGYYVWYDAFGWHLRVVDPQGSKFQGVIESSGSISAIPAPSGTAGSTQVPGSRLTFALNGSASPVGFDMAVGGCATSAMRFELNGGPGPWPIDQIFPGIEKRPMSNPFVIARSG